MPALMTLCCVVRCSYSPSFICLCGFSVNDFAQLCWWSTPQPLNPLSSETNRVMAEDAECQRKETKQVEWVENELNETLCEMSPSLEPASQRRINVARVVRSKSQVNETEGFSEARKCEKHPICLCLDVSWDGSICSDPVRNCSWWKDLRNKKRELHREQLQEQRHLEHYGSVTEAQVGSSGLTGLRVRTNSVKSETLREPNVPRDTCVGHDNAGVLKNPRTGVGSTTKDGRGQAAKQMMKSALTTS